MVRFQAVVRLFSTPFTPALGTHKPVLTKWTHEVISPGVKRLHPVPKNSRRYTFHAPICLHGVHRHKLAASRPTLGHAQHSEAALPPQVLHRPTKHAPNLAVYLELYLGSKCH